MRSPLRPSAWLSNVVGAEVLLKLETLQPTFSYKIRGALNAVLRLAESSGDRSAALVTASAGNHGRALAFAANAAGMRLTVYVPEHAPRTKCDAIRAAGADLRLCRDYDEAERLAREHALSGAAQFISPYNHPDVIAGAGTIGVELLEERPDIDLIIVPVGGGGLISGIAIAASAMGRASVLGVEAEASAPFTRGLAAGRVVQIEVHPTLADGLAGNLDPDTVTFDIVRQLVSRIVLVSETDLGAAIRGVAINERLIAEGAGVAGVAAAIAGKVDVRRQQVAIVLSGANIDLDVLKTLL